MFNNVPLNAVSNLIRTPGFFRGMLPNYPILKKKKTCSLIKSHSLNLEYATQRDLGGRDMGADMIAGLDSQCLMPWRINTTKHNIHNLIGYKLYPRSPPGLLPGNPRYGRRELGRYCHRKGCPMIHVPPKSGYHFPIRPIMGGAPQWMISPLWFKARFIQVLPILYPQYIINISRSLTFHHCLVACWNQHCFQQHLRLPIISDYPLVMSK